MCLFNGIGTAYEYDFDYAKYIAYLRAPRGAALRGISWTKPDHIHQYSYTKTSFCTASINAILLIWWSPTNGFTWKECSSVLQCPAGGHLGREDFSRLCLGLFLAHMYKWARNWISTYKVFQLVKPSSSSQAPLRRLLIADEAWRSVSIDFIFKIAIDSQHLIVIMVFIDRFSSATHLVPGHFTITEVETAVHFVEDVLRYHESPWNIVLDHYRRFTSAFWTSLFELLGKPLKVSTAAHLEIDE